MLGVFDAWDTGTDSKIKYFKISRLKFYYEHRVIHKTYVTCNIFSKGDSKSFDGSVF